VRGEPQVHEAIPQVGEEGVQVPKRVLIWLFAFHQ
jgi:hypothetical protein